MKNLARQWPTSEIHLLMAEVKGRVEDHYLVLMNQALARADRAAGCLLEPEVGDVVLMAAMEDGRIFILAVLTRDPNQTEAIVSAPGQDVVLKGERINIKTEKELALSSPHLEFEAETGQARVKSLFVQGCSLETRFINVRTICRAMETVADRAIESLGRLYRRIFEFEETKAGRMRLLVDGLFFLNSKNTSLRSDRSVKIDAEKIHLG